MKKSNIFMSIAAAAVVFGAYTIYSDSSSNMMTSNNITSNSSSSDESSMSYSLSSLNEISPAAGTQEAMKDSSPMEAMESATSQMMADAKDAKNEHHEKMHEDMQHADEQLEAKCKEHAENDKCMDNEEEMEMENHNKQEEEHGEHSHH